MGRQFILGLILVSFNLFSHAQPIALHPENPHYFIYGGKPRGILKASVIFRMESPVVNTLR